MSSVWTIFSENDVSGLTGRKVDVSGLSIPPPDQDLGAIKDVESTMRRKTVTL